jgi:hypothetical protein
MGYEWGPLGRFVGQIAFASLDTLVCQGHISILPIIKIIKITVQTKRLAGKICGSDSFRFFGYLGLSTSYQHPAHHKNHKNHSSDKMAPQERFFGVAYFGSRLGSLTFE